MLPSMCSLTWFLKSVLALYSKRSWTRDVSPLSETGWRALHLAYKRGMGVWFGYRLITSPKNMIYHIKFGGAWRINHIEIVYSKALLTAGHQVTDFNSKKCIVLYCTVRMLGSQPASSRARTQPSWPLSAAWYRAVSPSCNTDDPSKKCSGGAR